MSEENKNVNGNGRVKFGIVDWNDTPPKFNNNDRKPVDDLPKLDFMRLVKGNNALRIVSAPAKYVSHKLKITAGEKGFGKRVYCSKPLHDTCPICEKGHRAKPRYVAVVIDRADGQLKLLDMSTVIYNQLHGLTEDIECGNPSEYDINIRCTPEAGAAGYYTVIPRAKSALSEKDVELINSVGRETLDKILVRRVSPPTPEQVVSRVQKLGGTIEGLPPPPAPPAKAGEAKGNLVATEEEDYSFDQQATN